LWFCEWSCYHLKKDAQEGKNARSCLGHMYPDLKGKLPRSGRALRTWSKLQGTVEREPLAWAGAGLVLDDLIKKNPEMGLAMWLQLDALLREQDIDQLAWEDVVVSSSGRVALELGQLHRGETTKGGPRQGVEVLSRFLGRRLAKLKEGKDPQAAVFTFSISQYNKALKASVVVVYGDDAAAEIEATADVNRHSGAVHLLRDLKWSYPKVQTRGRREEEKSVRWYAKPHLQVKNESRLSGSQVARGNSFWEYEENIFGPMQGSRVTSMELPLSSPPGVPSSSYPELEAIPR
jgi:hypothetical protein